MYAADSLHYLGQGKYISRKYSEIINPPRTDDRTAEEIAEDILDRIGF